MDRFIISIIEAIRDSLPDLHVYDESWLDSDKNPAVLLSGFREEPLDRLAITKARYLTELFFRATLRHKEDINNLDPIKFQVRDEMYEQLRRLLLEQPNNDRIEFLNEFVNKSTFRGSSMERVPISSEETRFYIYHHIDISYTIVNYWEVC